MVRGGLLSPVFTPFPSRPSAPPGAGYRPSHADSTSTARPGTVHLRDCASARSATGTGNLKFLNAASVLISDGEFRGLLYRVVRPSASTPADGGCREQPPLRGRPYSDLHITPLDSEIAVVRRPQTGPGPLASDADVGARRLPTFRAGPKIKGEHIRDSVSACLGPSDRSLSKTPCHDNSGCHSAVDNRLDFCGCGAVVTRAMIRLSEQSSACNDLQTCGIIFFW